MQTGKEPPETDNCTRCTRRTFVRRLGGGLVLAAAIQPLVGCGLLEEAEMALCTRSELAQQGYYLGVFNDDGVLAQLDETGAPYVLELVCTHKQCRVEYFPGGRQILCPCHKGRYDRFGQVTYGPPPAPLRRLKCEWRKDTLWVLNETVAAAQPAS